MNDSSSNWYDDEWIIFFILSIKYLWRVFFNVSNNSRARMISWWSRASVFIFWEMWVYCEMTIVLSENNEKSFVMTTEESFIDSICFIIDSSIILLSRLCFFFSRDHFLTLNSRFSCLDRFSLVKCFFSCSFVMIKNNVCSAYNNKWDDNAMKEWDCKSEMRLKRCLI